MIKSLINIIIYYGLILTPCFSTLLDELEKKSSSLSKMNSAEDLSSTVESLRSHLSSMPSPHQKATLNDVNRIIKLIVDTEAAKMLVNGNFGFNFSQDYYNLAVIKEIKYQTHYAYVFWIVKVSHLLLECPRMNNPLLHQTILFSARAYTQAPWLYKNITKFSDEGFYNCLHGIINDKYLETFEFAKVRKKERAGDIKNRIAFTVSMTEEQEDWIHAVSQKKGIPFSPNILENGKHYTFHTYKIIGDGSCVYHSIEGPYGRADSRDLRKILLEQIVDNLEVDPINKYVEKTHIDDWTTIMTGVPPSSWKKPAKTLKEFENAIGTPPRDHLTTTYKKSPALSYLEKKGYKASSVPSRIPTHILKKVITKEFNYYEAEFHWIITCIDVIAYLNGYNFIEVNPKDGFKSHSCHMFKNGINRFLTGNDFHVSRAVLYDHTSESLIAYIKAIAHEQAYTL